MTANLPPFPEILDFVPDLRADLLIRRIDTEAVVWSPIRSQPEYLDPVAAVMLDVFDGQASVATLIREVCDELGVDDEVARDQVVRVVRLYDGAGLLRTSAAEEAPWSDDTLFLEPPNY